MTTPTHIISADNRQACCGSKETPFVGISSAMLHVDRRSVVCVSDGTRNTFRRRADIMTFAEFVVGWFAVSFGIVIVGLWRAKPGPPWW
jgi:hypothetical protein